MNRPLPKLQRDADRIERMMGGVTDDLSLETLREYAAEIDAQIWRMRFSSDTVGE